MGASGKKRGDVQLRWAVADAAVRFLRQNQPGKEDFAKRARKPGTGKALTVRAPNLARAGYDLLAREQAVALPRVVTAYPLRSEREPTGSLAPKRQRLTGAPSFSTAQTVTEHLDERPGARGVE